MGAAAMDDNTEAGGGEAGGEACGSVLGASFDDWPDDDEAEIIPRRQSGVRPWRGLLRRAACSGRRAEAPGRVGLVRQSAEEAQGRGGGDQAG